MELSNDAVFHQQGRKHSHFKSTIKMKNQLSSVSWYIYKPSDMHHLEAVSFGSSAVWTCTSDKAERFGHRDKTPFVQRLPWDRQQRQWGFSSMSLIVTLDFTEAHSQIRSCALQLGSLCRHRRTARCSGSLSLFSADSESSRDSLRKSTERSISYCTISK